MYVCVGVCGWVHLFLARKRFYRSGLSHSLCNTNTCIKLQWLATGALCPQEHAMAVTDFREGAYAQGIVCDGCACSIALGSLRYFCRECYDEHPASGGADYCMECVQPGVAINTTVHSAYVIVYTFLPSSDLSLSNVVALDAKTCVTGTLSTLSIPAYYIMIIKGQLSTSSSFSLQTMSLV